MIEICVIQTVRIACDRCGNAAAWEEKVEKARLQAQADDFHESRWMQDGCARELWLCDLCFKAAQQGRRGGSPERR